jgi:uncharacterized protein YdaU (DUF1376 family)
MLPNDDQYLSKICGMDKRTWLSNKDVLLSFWDEQDGFIYQKRLRDELQFCNARRESNSRAGRLSALKNKERHSTSVEQVCNTNSTNPQPTPTKKERESDKSLSSCAREFDEFWKIYPKNNGSKKTAEEKYGIAIKSGISPEQLRAGAEAYAGYVGREETERRYIAHAATWLQQKRWEVDYSSDKPASGNKTGWQSEQEKLLDKIRSGEFNPRGNVAVRGSSQPALPNPSQLRENLIEPRNDSDGIPAIPAGIHHERTD